MRQNGSKFAYFFSFETHRIGPAQCLVNCGFIGGVPIIVVFVCVRVGYEPSEI